jgi:hypothetical protein
LKKLVILILISISMIGCSSLIEKAKVINEQAIAEREKQIKETKEGYERLEKYKNDNEYTLYEMKEKTKRKFIFGETRYVIADKYSVGRFYFTEDHIALWISGKGDIYLYENDNKIFKIKYRAKGLRHCIPIFDEFSIKIDDLIEKNDVKVGIGDIPYEKINGLIRTPSIKSIEYKGKKIEAEESFVYDDTLTDVGSVLGGYKREITTRGQYKSINGKSPDKISELKVIINKEEQGIMIFQEDSDEKNFKDGKIIVKKACVFIKKETDSDMKDLIFKFFLLQVMNKNMEPEISNDFDKVK